MPLYKYKSINSAGEEREEVKEFADKGALYAYIRNLGETIVSAEETKSKKVGRSFFTLKKKVKMTELITFANNLAVMTEAGLSISRALSIMVKQSKNKRFKEILEDITALISQGQTLSSALEKHNDVFSNLFVSMVSAGEESGKLGYSLRTIAGQLEKANSLTKKIKGAMIYPTVIICLMVVIGIVLMVYMVPTLTATFVGLNIKLPLPTRIVIAISDFLRNNIILVLLGLVGLVVGFITFLKTQRGQRMIDWLILHMPIFGTMSKEVNAARTTRTLASLVSSGVDIVESLHITGNVIQNSYFKEIVEATAKKVEVGELLSASLQNNLYPIFVSEMLSVGEETGKMTDMLNNVATYYENEIDQKTKDLSTIIEPFLMILIGIAVGAFAIAMLLPTYSLVDAIK